MQVPQPPLLLTGGQSVAPVSQAAGQAHSQPHTQLPASLSQQGWQKKTALEKAAVAQHQDVGFLGLILLRSYEFHIGETSN